MEGTDCGEEGGGAVRSCEDVGEGGGGGEGLRVVEPGGGVL